MPRTIDEDLRHYYLSHGASSSELGANGMNARLVSLRLSGDTAVEAQAGQAPVDDAADDDEAADEPSTRP